MKKFVFSLLIFIAVAAFCLYVNKRLSNSAALNNVASRVISLAPSITETIYYLGQWDKLVGLTRYCVYPPMADDLPKIGGIQDINYEAILSLNPDLVIVDAMQSDAAYKLRSFGINTVVVNYSTISDVKKSFNIIGEALGVADNASKLIETFNAKEREIMNKIAPYNSKTVIFSIFREIGSSKIISFTTVGNDGYYSEILKLLNAVNPLDKFAAYPTISREGLYKIDPDVIIELSYISDLIPIAKKEWKDLDNLKAIKNNNLCIISNSYGYVPGPRYTLLLDELARCIYREAFNGD